MKKYIKIILILIAVLLVGGAAMYYITYPKTMNARWQRDVQYLASNLPKMHGDLFVSLSEEEFNKRMQDLIDDIPGIDSEEEIIIRLKEIFTLTDDAHLMVIDFESDIQKVFGMVTFMNIFLEPGDGQIFPIKAKWFGEDLHIVETGKAYQEMLGSKVIEIGGEPVNDVMDRINTLIPHNNEYRLRSYNAMYLIKPSILKHFNLSDGNKVSYTVENGTGEREVFEITAEEYEESNFIHIISDDMKPNYMKKDDLFWYEYLPEHEAVYFRLTAYTDKKDNIRKTFKNALDPELADLDEFLSEMDAFLADKQVRKFILDLRDNNGGRFGVADRLLEFIRNNEKINKPDVLYLIVNNGCFSMPVYDCERYKNSTYAAIYGEPTGEMPFEEGYAYIMTLPYSKKHILYSRKPFMPIDERDAFIPDVVVSTTFDEYVNGIDTPLEMILKGD